MGREDVEVCGEGERMDEVKMNIIRHARNTVDCAPTMAYLMLLTQLW